MLTIISMIIGFATSILPEIMKKWQDASDKKHELAILEMQAKYTTLQEGYKADAIAEQAYSAMVVAANQSQAEMVDKASQWVINFSASVRPMVTYLLLVAFIGFKICLFIAAINPSLPWQGAIPFHDAMLSVWGEEENAMVTGIMAYWFGSRQMIKK